MDQREEVRFWAVVEIFGHQVLAGELSEATIGDQGFVRVDVPAEDGVLGFTKYYGPGAVYSISPCSEEVVREHVRQNRPRPVGLWLPELRLLGDGEVDF